MSADPRESPEWAEYERLRAEVLNAEAALGEAVNDSEATDEERAAAYERVTASVTALNAFVLRLLAERREPVGYAEIESTEWTGREYLTRLQWVTLEIPSTVQYALHPVEP